MRVLNIGEILWDVFPDRELLGGAPLNFSANVSRLGESAALITAVGKDDRGYRAQELMGDLGISTKLLAVSDYLPTGIATVHTGSDGEPRFEISRPAAFDSVRLSEDTLKEIARFKPDWFYFGTLLQMNDEVEAGHPAIGTFVSKHALLLRSESSTGQLEL